MELYKKYLKEESAVVAKSGSNGTEALGSYKRGDTVILKMVKGDSKKWGIEQEDFDTLKSHIGDSAKVVDVDGFLLHLKFDDGFEVKNVNDGQVSERR